MTDVKSKSSSKQAKLKSKSKALQPVKKEAEEIVADPGILEEKEAVVSVASTNDEAIVIDNTDWESDLDIDDIVNKKVVKDPYLSACEEFGTVPSTMVVKGLNTTEINLVNHGLGPAGARALGKVLELNTSVNRLDLTGNCISGKYLCPNLAQNRAITFLNLSWNDLSQASVELSGLIAENTTITTLILSHSNLGDKGASAIAEGLPSNPTLKVLDISYNKIRDIGGIALGKALSANHNIAELDLSFNEIRSKGLAGFLSNAKDCSSLQNLSIANNGLADSAPALLPFLQKSTVCRLSLAYTRMGESVLGMLIKGITPTSPLKELDLSGNNIPAPLLQSIFKAISGSQITNLSLKNVRFNREMTIFIEGLKKDSNLKIED